VTVKRKDDSKPKWKAVSDGRGEFAVRLPPGRQTYDVATQSKKYENETKTIEIEDRETVNVIFILSEKKDGQEQQ
jgi:hypothetical protein